MLISSCQHWSWVQLSFLPFQWLHWHIACCIAFSSSPFLWVASSFLGLQPWGSDPLLYRHERAIRGLFPSWIISEYKICNRKEMTKKNDVSSHENKDMIILLKLPSFYAVVHHIHTTALHQWQDKNALMIQSQYWGLYEQKGLNPSTPSQAQLRVGSYIGRFPPSDQLSHCREYLSK